MLSYGGEINDKYCGRFLSVSAKFHLNIQYVLLLFICGYKWSVTAMRDS